MKRKNRQDEHSCVFTFKTTADLVAKCGKQSNADVWGTGAEMEVGCREIARGWQGSTYSQLLFSSFLKDAIEGFFVFDKVANSTKKKITEWIS